MRLLGVCSSLVLLQPLSCISFFFQAEDGIRVTSVTGVQTCALPIYFTTSKSCQLARQAAPLERLDARPRRRRRHGRTEHLPERARELYRARVLERIYVGAESLLASRLHIELAQQIEVACDVHAAVRDQHGVRARHDLEAGVLARDLLQEANTLFRSDELERHDLRHEPEWGRGGEVFSDPHRPRRRADRKSTRLNSSHRCISYAVFCLKKKNTNKKITMPYTT